MDSFHNTQNILYFCREIIIASKKTNERRRLESQGFGGIPSQCPDCGH